MQEIKTLSSELKRLAVLRRLYNEPAFCAFSNMLENGNVHPELVGEFASLLYEKGDDLSAFIMSAVLDCDNPCFTAAALGKAPDSCIVKAAK